MVADLVFLRFHFGSLWTIVVICISLSVSVANADSRIVGGVQASVGEYPYFGTYRDSSELS